MSTLAVVPPSKDGGTAMSLRNEELHQMNGMFSLQYTEELTDVQTSCPEGYLSKASRSRPTTMRTSTGVELSSPLIWACSGSSCRSPSSCAATGAVTP